MAELPLHLQRDPYGDKILSGTFDWRDERVMRMISEFVTFGKIDSVANIKRQSESNARRIKSGKGRKKSYNSTGKLLRSVAWKTWSRSGGDEQVFHAHYLYYNKFVELALGKGDPFRGLPPGIPVRRWAPIRMPDRTRRARPSVPTEMRKRARRFITSVQDHFSYAGVAMMAYSMSADNEHSAQINRAMFASGLAGRR